jgi:hypothetical protein
VRGNDQRLAPQAFDAQAVIARFERQRHRQHALAQHDAVDFVAIGLGQ